MSPPAESTDAQRKFARDVLRNLLRHIETRNLDGFRTFLVSHAWTHGTKMYLVYTAPSSPIPWGLVRDTTQSIINPGPWQDLDEAVRYYYLLDLEEDWPGLPPEQPLDPHTIQSAGHEHDGLPARVEEIPNEYRYQAPKVEHTIAPPVERPAVSNEPRRYADPA